VSVVWIVVVFIMHYFLGAGCDGEGARVATIRFHSHVEIFLHISFVPSILNFSSELLFFLSELCTYVHS